MIPYRAKIDDPAGLPIESVELIKLKKEAKRIWKLWKKFW
jgi:hypothetical protein